MMVGAFFVGHEAVAKVLIGTAGDDTLVGNDRDERLTGRDGEDRLEAVKLGGFVGTRKERHEHSSENLESSGDPADPSERNRVGRHRMHGGWGVLGDGRAEYDVRHA
jgi:hypothetical protein